MQRLFNTGDGQTRLLALVYFVFGILLCFFASSILVTATRILGGCLALYGALQLYLFYAGRQKGTATGAQLCIGVATVLFGLIFVISPESLISIFPVAGAIILIVNSLIQMQKAFQLRDYGCEGWTMTLIFAVVLLVAGAIILLRPVQTASFILQIVGISLMAEAIMMFWSQHEIDKYMPRGPRES